MTFLLGSLDPVLNLKLAHTHNNITNAIVGLIPRSRVVSWVLHSDALAAPHEAQYNDINAVHRVIALQQKESNLDKRTHQRSVATRKTPRTNVDPLRTERKCTLTEKLHDLNNQISNHNIISS